MKDILCGSFRCISRESMCSAEGCVKVFNEALIEFQHASKAPHFSR